MEQREGEQRRQRFWRNRISQRKVKLKLRTSMQFRQPPWSSDNYLGVQTTVDFYYGFWSLETRLASLLGTKPLPTRGNHLRFVDGDFDDNIHDDILFEKCFSK